MDLNKRLQEGSSMASLLRHSENTGDIPHGGNTTDYRKLTKSAASYPQLPAGISYSPGKSSAATRITNPTNPADFYSRNRRAESFESREPSLESVDRQSLDKNRSLATIPPNPSRDANVNNTLGTNMVVGVGSNALDASSLARQSQLENMCVTYINNCEHRLDNYSRDGILVLYLTKCLRVKFNRKCHNC